MTTRRTSSIRRGLIATTAALGLAAAACTPPATTTRVSVGPTGSQTNGGSNDPSISADGRLVAFSSRASNLGGGAFSVTDVFLKDRSTGSVTLISRAGAGQNADGDSVDPSVSNDGSRIAFRSLATNLGGGGSSHDVFVQVRNGSVANTRLVSRAVSAQNPNGPSFGPDVSGDGRFVAFESAASNLVPSDTNGQSDVFLHDLGTGTNRRVSTFPGGGQLPGVSFAAAVSNTGRVAFITTTRALPSQDTDGNGDVYVTDASGGLTLASLNGAGTGATSVDISDDGRFVAFVSPNGAQPQVFVRDLTNGQLALISHRTGTDDVGGNGASAAVSIAPDGSHVTFTSKASDLVAGDTNGTDDHFVASRTGTGLTRVSVRSDGSQSSGSTSPPDVSNGGREVVFPSGAADLVAGDTNGVFDVFVRDRG
jgi:Tol biopolymer transport system component